MNLNIQDKRARTGRINRETVRAVLLTDAALVRCLESEFSCTVFLTILSIVVSHVLISSESARIMPPRPSVNYKNVALLP